MSFYFEDAVKNGMSFYFEDVVQNYLAYILKYKVMLNGCQVEINNYEEILNRLKAVLSAKSDADIARGLGISAAALSAFKKQRRFPCDRLVKFCLATRLSIDWLLTGKIMRDGPIYGYKADIPKELEIAESPKAQLVSDAAKAMIRSGNLSPVQIYEAKGIVSAEGLGETGVVETLALEKWRIKGDSRGLRVTGTSMEPTIIHGSIVLVTPQFDLTDGGVYLLRISEQGITIKRVYFGYEELILRSDNPLFPEIKISLQEQGVKDIVIGKIETVLLQEVR